MRTRIIPVVALVLAAGCGCLRKPGSASAPKTVTSVSRTLVSTDKQSQITLPPGWAEKADLHDEAELQAANPPKELYLIVLTEPKADFHEYTHEKYSQLTSN